MGTTRRQYDSSGCSRDPVGVTAQDPPVSSGASGRHLLLQPWSLTTEVAALSLSRIQTAYVNLNIYICYICMYICCVYFKLSPFKMILVSK